MDAITRSSAASALTANRQNASAPNVSSPQSARDTAGSSRTDMPQRAQQRRQEEQVTNRQQAQRDQLQNVVSRSEDGDTVQVQSRAEELLARSEDGQVKRREDQKAAEEAARRAQEERMAEIRKAQMEAAQAAQQQKDNGPAQINSFAGYTSSQLEQLYAQGRISRQEYEQEMASRQEREAARMANNTLLNVEAARLNGESTRAQMDGQAIRTAFSDRASQTAPLTSGERIDAMQRIQDQRTQQTVQNNNEGRRTWAYQLQA